MSLPQKNSTKISDQQSVFWAPMSDGMRTVPFSLSQVASTTLMLSERVDSHHHKILPRPSLSASGKHRGSRRGGLCVCPSIIRDEHLPPPVLSASPRCTVQPGRPRHRKDSIILPVLTHGKSAALPSALVSVVLLSRATDRGHKMGLEGTQHRAVAFLIASGEAEDTGMKRRGCCSHEHLKTFGCFICICFH